MVLVFGLVGARSSVGSFSMRILGGEGRGGGDLLSGEFAIGDAYVHLFLTSMWYMLYKI